MTTLATWFTPDLKTMSRSSGASAVAAAAYRACINLIDERTGIAHRYKGKKGHVSTQLFGFDDIAQLWNAAEKAENRKNSVVARELMVPMPNDWTDEQRQECSRDFAKMLRQRYGVAVQVSLHRPSKGKNHHAHILFTTRTVDEYGVFGQKTRALDEGLKTGEVSRLREAVCEIMNQHAQRIGSTWQAYAGKFAEVVKDHIPTKHVPRNVPATRRKELEAENAAIVNARGQLRRLGFEARLVRKTLKKKRLERVRIRCFRTLAEFVKAPLTPAIVKESCARSSVSKTIEMAALAAQAANVIEHVETPKPEPATYEVWDLEPPNPWDWSP